MGYRHGAHTVFGIHLHPAWTTKHRKPVMRGEVGRRVREVIRQVCRSEEVDVLKGPVSNDHVHLFVSIPPQVGISRLVQRVKGKRHASFPRELVPHPHQQLVLPGARVLQRETDERETLPSGAGRTRLTEREKALDLYQRAGGLVAGPASTAREPPPPLVYRPPRGSRSILRK